jgi:phospholipase/lecithinase/hemolysin
MLPKNFYQSFVVVLSLWVLQPLAASAHDWQAPPPVFDKVVVFGDSLSDPGNVFALTGQYSVRPFAPIPSAPYAIGGFHFTNGETWVERLSRGLRSRTGAGPAVRVPQLYTNYAFGGARARSGASASPDLSAQIAMYFANQGSAVSAESLHVIWFGANDVRDALEALAVDPTGATTGGIVQAAIAAIGNNVVTLWSAGARTLLVPNVPNLALTPAVAAQPAQVRAIAAQLSAAYNAALAQVLSRLEAQLPGIRIVRLDVYALLNSIVASPSLYGITNTVEPCLRFGVVAGAICAEPWRYVFWDAIHPTAAVHRILAERALATVAP